MEPVVIKEDGKAGCFMKQLYNLNNSTYNSTSSVGLLYTCCHEGQTLTVYWHLFIHLTTTSLPKNGQGTRSTPTYNIF